MPHSETKTFRICISYLKYVHNFPNKFSQRKTYGFFMSHIEFFIKKIFSIFLAYQGNFLFKYSPMLNIYLSHFGLKARKITLQSLPNIILLFFCFVFLKANFKIKFLKFYFIKVRFSKLSLLTGHICSCSP